MCVCVERGGSLKTTKSKEWEGGRWRVCVMEWGGVGGYLAGVRALFKRERVSSIVSQLNTTSEIQGEGG